MACFNLENSPKSRRHVSMLNTCMLKQNTGGSRQVVIKISPDGRFHDQDIQSIH